jgi:hypothetical protein
MHNLGRHTMVISPLLYSQVESAMQHPILISVMRGTGGAPGFQLEDTY